MSDREKNALDKQMQRLETLIESLEKLSNPAARIVAQELVQSVLSLHGVGLARMLEIAQQTDGAAAVAAWGQDDLVSNLLMLHGVHPISLETRARQAMERVQPVVRCSGGELELVAVTGSAVRIRVRGGCALSPQELEHTLEESFAELAPDVRLIEVETPGSPQQRIGLPVV